ncbi:MAG: hypothetical protein E7058_04745 [Lentisphaerae bacterium]|nr:hypothetical protein [Lentisphaerota bacterium]
MGKCLVLFAAVVSTLFLCSCKPSVAKAVVKASKKVIGSKPGSINLVKGAAHTPRSSSGTFNTVLQEAGEKGVNYVFTGAGATGTAAYGTNQYNNNVRRLPCNFCQYGKVYDYYGNLINCNMCGGRGWYTATF